MSISFLFATRRLPISSSIVRRPSLVSFFVHAACVLSDRPVCFLCMHCCTCTCAYACAVCTLPYPSCAPSRTQPEKAFHFAQACNKASTYLPPLLVVPSLRCSPFRPALFGSVLPCPVPSHFVPLRPISSRSASSHFVRPRFVPSRFIPSRFIPLRFTSYRPVRFHPDPFHPIISSSSPFRSNEYFMSHTMERIVKFLQSDSRPRQTSHIILLFPFHPRSSFVTSRPVGKILIYL